MVCVSNNYFILRSYSNNLPKEVNAIIYSEKWLRINLTSEVFKSIVAIVAADDPERLGRLEEKLVEVLP